MSTIWPWIGTYFGPIGADCLCFLKFIGFVRAGSQFESHLGHSFSAGQMLFVFSLLTKLDFFKFWCFGGRRASRRSAISKLVSVVCPKRSRSEACCRR